MVTDLQKKEIFEALQSSIGLGVHPVARVFMALHEAGFAPRELGYESDRELLADVPECFEILTDSEDTEVLLFAYGENHASGDDAFPAAARPYLDMPLNEWVFFPFRNLGILEQKTGIASAELESQLCEAYRIAREEKTLTCYEEKLNFPFTAPSVSGGTITIILKQSEPDRPKPWYFNYVMESMRPAEYVAPGKLLERFAYMGSWPAFLQKLSELALPERWDYGQETGKYAILRSYITYTFARLYREKKICIAEDESFAAFNTGLVTRNYEDIYACFEPNGDNTSAWRFADFCVAARRGLGKQLVNLFNPLPKTATYFQRKEDLLYDLDRPLLSDYEHIIVENVHRLPLEFLEEQCYNAPEAKEILDELKACQDFEEREALYNQLRELLSDDDRLYNRLKNRVEDAIELARKMVRWNFKTALPSYYPTADSMSLMLPLFLCSDNRVDNVLVVELTDSGNYQGQTILTPKQAYLDARLVCRPDSDWLTPTSMTEDEQ